MSSLRNKVAVVTGGSSGIGLATAKRFVDEGAYVFIAGRRQAELDKAAAEIGENVTAIEADLSTPRSSTGCDSCQRKSAQFLGDRKCHQRTFLSWCLMEWQSFLQKQTVPSSLAVRMPRFRRRILGQSGRSRCNPS